MADERGAGAEPGQTECVGTPDAGGEQGVSPSETPRDGKARPTWWPERLCVECGRIFRCRPADVARGYGRHCSHRCSAIRSEREKAAGTTHDRFWAKIDRSGGPEAYWPWTGRRNGDGWRTRYEAAVARTADDAAEGARLLAWIREIGRLAEDTKAEPATGSIHTASALAVIRLAVERALRGDVCPPLHDVPPTTQRRASR